MAAKTKDGILRVQLLHGQARAILVRATDLTEAARKTHNLSRTATAALGRLLAATAMLGAQLKSDTDALTCAVRGDGPIGQMIAVATNDGYVRVKGYVENPNVELERVRGKLAVGDAVGHTGTLTVIRDLGLKEPYVGRTQLVSGELAEDFAEYFAVSEQTPSVVSLGVLTGDAVVGAGGLIVQMMPGASEAAIASVEGSTEMFRDISRVFAEFDLRQAAAQLLTHLEMEILEETRVAYHCDCGRERIERALISMGAKELSEMIEEQHQAEVSCQFCTKKYLFSEEELRALLAAATR